MVEDLNLNTGERARIYDGHEPPSIGGAAGRSKIGTSLVGAPISITANTPIVLSTKRLTLRPPHRRDAPEMTKLANNPQVAMNLGRMPHPYTLEDAHNWIEKLRASGERSNSFAIVDRFTDQFLGACGYQPNDDDQINIGYWLGEPHWGNGYAAEAAHAMIDHIFENEDADAVWVNCRVTNNQSRRVIAKCGFQFAYTGMAESLALGGMVPVEHYSLSRSTWESLHLWGTR